MIFDLFFLHDSPWQGLACGAVALSWARNCGRFISFLAATRQRCAVEIPPGVMFSRHSLQRHALKQQSYVLGYAHAHQMRLERSAASGYLPWNG